MTPRFEDHDVISDTALSFDHTHPKGNAVSHGSESSTIASDTTSGTLQSTGGATSNSAIADAQQRTQAAKAGENLPYGDLPMGERFDNAVHSLNLVTSYNDDALPAFKDSTDKRSVYTYRGRDISNRADYGTLSEHTLLVVTPSICKPYFPKSQPIELPPPNIRSSASSHPSFIFSSPASRRRSFRSPRCVSREWHSRLCFLAQQVPGSECVFDVHHRFCVAGRLSAALILAFAPTSLTHRSVNLPTGVRPRALYFFF